tara:strand:+ start:192 stop:1040 length:849 start_codon:yes stop_codon:yes gene_type:complete
VELIINDVSFNITLYNTNFTDYWFDRVFKNNNTVEVTLEDKDLVNNDIVDRKKDLKNLTNKIHEINNTIERYSFNWIKPFPIEPLSQEWLCKIHEQWAETTLYMEARTHLQYGSEALKLANELDDNMYWEINPLVHLLEFDRQNFRLSLLIFSNLYQLSRDSKEYTVKATDTSFFKSNIISPYNDIGRPQFEEWLFKKRITNETSNFINISGLTDILFLHEYRYPDNCIDEYKVYCNENNLEEWGPILNIGKFSNYTYMTNNFDKFWHTINTDSKIRIILKE